MRKKSSAKMLIIGMIMLMFAGILVPAKVLAEEGSEASENNSQGGVSGTNISLMPVSKVLQISSNSSYEDKMTISNDGNDAIEIEVYAAPYSYVYSEEDGISRLGFNRENNFTQIVRWITFDNGNGEWAKKANYKIPAHESVDVKYKITTPDNIPAGGQYAVIFAHTLTSVVSANGIKTEASPGMVIYGRSNEGEVKVMTDISDMQISFGTSPKTTSEENKQGKFYASAKVKNSGNVDFSATGKLKVDGILGFGSYETPADKGRVSVIPDSELEVSDEWEDSPSFGLYKAVWTVTAGQTTETVETIVFVNPLPVIIITIIVLTIIIIWITIVVRKRKERRSRLAV